MLMDIKMFFRMELVLEAKDSGMMLVIMTATLGEVAGKMHIPHSYHTPPPSVDGIDHLRGRDPAGQRSK